MDQLSYSELQGIAASKDWPSVTLLLPLHCTWPQKLEDAVEWRNLVDQAQSHLRDSGLSQEAAADLLSPARQLCDDESFWESHGARGLAVLLNSKGSQRYLLPFPCDRAADVADRFYVSPLLQWLSWPVDFYVLALSQNRTRLFRGDADRLATVELPAGTPESLDQFLETTEFDPALQYHATPGFGHGPTGSAHGGTSALLHGHGDSRTTDKALVTSYIQAVGKGLTPLLERDGIPLVLAAVGYYHPIFRAACQYSRLLQTGLTGTADHFSDQELREGAEREVRYAAAQSTERLIERFHDQRRRGQASDLLREIIPAAESGRVEAIVAERGRRLWGRLNVPAEEIAIRTECEAGDSDLLDEAVRATLLHQGQIRFVEPGSLPDQSPAIALFRW